uniref:Transcription initiation factor TFIID subunit 4 n=2 Tax=Drosophila melanogaster TaxID=7227 RepID=TAF4_DROME|nr:TBP-associated factor 4, isoform F [Drosophila melanogaster]NP_001287077.1 TBP-associated factor 4, isoform I [Drosophila melanogaster]NP_524102.1 TBP-associated factor 4, isoform A [Drosophila melanogaster]NP_730109.1 TBP-associated factor 4, isoform B [Drosophila melanogaster]P47825.1 RecName: Full=Transcription initiation factor TFIID subunit 4; AltName: Full=110 kDa TBP-associated factor; AltName: Full=Transcription initiation factor TFIID 110 kDa subunit; Short=TAFII-110; Short=p110 [Dr|eukprot:NP_001163453.1 TBP-associated factor 4, isoform F [Drosophila melanogaster]
MNTSQTAAGNRITFTSQPLPNGTISIAGNPGAVISTAQLPNTTTIKTIQAGIGGQHQGLQQVHHVQQQQQSQQQQQQQQQTQSAGQPLLNSMLPAGVVVGMRQQAPSQQQQKNVPTNPLSRVVINSHMAGVRPQSPSITLSTLNTGQTPALLVKTDNGFQLLRVGTTTGPPTVTQTITNTSNNSNTTSTTNHPTTTQIRLQTVPAAASMTNTTATSNIIVNSVASSGYANSSQPPHLTQLNAQAPQLPQITQIQTIPAQQSQQQQVNNVSSAGGTATAVSSTTAATTTQQGNTKEKCRKFLANLIELSTREPKPVEKNVRTLIQELVNANVEPEEFCDRLERLLNASPQPCLIGFLKKSLPLLRQALYTKELVIEGIKPPPQHVLGLAGLSQQLPKIQAQIRPIGPSQTTTIGQTQVRMITPNALGTPRPTIGHTTISKQPPNIRLPTAPRLVNTGGIRTQIPSLQVPGQANIVQIRGPQHAQLQRTGSVQIRATTRPPNSVPTANKLTAVKVGQTQIKAITPSLHPPSLAAISGGPPPTPTLSVLSTLNSASTTTLPIPSLPTVHLPPEALRAREQMQNSLNHNSNHFDAKLVEIKAPSLHPPHMERINASLTPIGAKTMARPPPAINKAIGKKKRDAMEMDAKLNTSSGGAASAANSFFQQSSMSSMYGDDDINDVAAMGGVNLAEESQRILGCTENIGTQIRSCKDEVFLNLPSLQARIRAITSEAGLDEPSQDVAVLISHACQERLKNIVEKLAVIAEHRIDVIKLDPRYEPAKDVRGQIKFLEELDKAEQKRHEELEREMLLRAAKSRSRVEDPEQAKMKARAKEMQRAEMEELRQRDANLTALQAIGPRKKLKLDGETVSSGAGSSGGGVLSSSGSAPTTLRPRIKRVNLRDMLFYMEQEREFCRSSMLFKTYLK